MCTNSSRCAEAVITRSSTLYTYTCVSVCIHKSFVFVDRCYTLFFYLANVRLYTCESLSREMSCRGHRCTCRCFFNIPWCMVLFLFFFNNASSRIHYKASFVWMYKLPSDIEWIYVALIIFLLCAFWINFAIYGSQSRRRYEKYPRANAVLYIPTATFCVMYKTACSIYARTR